MIEVVLPPHYPFSLSLSLSLFLSRALKGRKVGMSYGHDAHMICVHEALLTQRAPCSGRWQLQFCGSHKLTLAAQKAPMPSHCIQLITAVRSYYRLTLSHHPSGHLASVGVFSFPIVLTTYASKIPCSSPHKYPSRPSENCTLLI